MTLRQKLNLGKMNSTIKRSISGALFLLIMAGSLLLSPLVFTVIMAIAVAIMLDEYLKIALGNTYKTGQVIAVITGISLYILFALVMSNTISSRFFWLITLPVASILILTLFEGDGKGGLRGEGYQHSGFLITSLIYIALPISLINTILFTGTGEYTPKYLLSLFILLWSADVGAYVFGMTFGQKRGHKLYPQISPKKSWEGFFGGAFTTLTAGVVLYYTNLLPVSLIHLMVIALIIFLLSVLGDLFESLFKRNFGVKDSGKIMPGHGGLLDRFDGALLSFPVAIAYIKTFALF